MEHGWVEAKLESQQQHIYGLTTAGRLSGMVMDIDRMQRQATDKDNQLNGLRAFIASQGARQSANEHLVPEALFDNKDTPEKEAEAISAVKALQIAAHSANASSCVGAKQCFATPSSGQKIFTITQTNLEQVLPQLAHKALIIQDVKDAVAAGKIVTISQTGISHQGWTGAGYSIVDPNTGAGAYLIGGGADGGFADYLPRFDSMDEAMYWSGFSLGTSISAIVTLLQAGGAIGFAIGALVIAPILITIGLVIRSGRSDTEKACFMGGIGEGGMLSSFGVSALNYAVGKGLIKYITKAIGEGSEGSVLAILGLNTMIGYLIAHWVPGSEGASCD